MKMKIKSIALGLVAFAAIVVSSCVYDEADHLMTGGTNFMRFLGIEDKFALVAITPDPQELAVVTVKRDPISSSELGKAASITLVPDAAVLDKYNTDNGTDFTLLPSASYTYVGSNTSINFAAGEDAKDVAINISPANLDLSLQYALAFVIKSPSTDYVLSSGYDTAVVQIIIKNQYDGTYHSVGTRYNFNAVADYTGWDGTNEVALGTIASTGPWDFDTDMATRGAATINVHAANSNGGFGYFNVTVNGDNTVSIASTGETGLANLKALTGPGAKQSYYNPTTKTFYLWYQYTNANGSHRVMYHVLTRK